MDRLCQLDRDELVCRMRADFEQTLLRVADAVNAAADGHLIDGSEEQVRDLLGDFRQRAYQMALQMRVEATEASPDFSPGEPGQGASRDCSSLGADVQRAGGGPPAPLRKRRRLERRSGG